MVVLHVLGWTKFGHMWQGREKGDGKGDTAVVDDGHTLSHVPILFLPPLNT